MAKGMSPPLAKEANTTLPSMDKGPNKNLAIRVFIVLLTYVESTHARKSPNKNLAVRSLNRTFAGTMA
jgi:hypothetical protein